MKIIKVRCGDGVIPRAREYGETFMQAPKGTFENFVKKVFASMKGVKISGVSPEFSSQPISWDDDCGILWKLDKYDSVFFFGFDKLFWNVGFKRGGKYIWHKSSKKYNSLEPSNFVNSAKLYIKKAEETLSMLKEV